MFLKDFDQISLPDIQYLADEGIPESRQLEYKRDHYGRKDENKREFAADVSAFANAIGGYLLIGIEEENGIASSIYGISDPNPDILIRGIADAIRNSCELPLIDFRIKWVAIDGDRGVLVIYIARSWSGPHRVTVAKDRHFYIRDENGKHPMSVEELRRAFLFGSEIEERIRRFRSERLETLTSNEGPLAVGNDGDVRLILHVVPHVAFTGNIQLTFRERGGTAWPWPLEASGANSMHCLEGLVRYSGPEGGPGTVRAFSTLFRNGIAEAVAKVAASRRDGIFSISLNGVERSVIFGVLRIFDEYRRRKIPGPYTILLSLAGVRGATAPINDRHETMAYPYRSDRIILPEFFIDSSEFTEKEETVLRPLFDLLWNGFGQIGSPNYDSQGKYTRY